MHEGYIASRIDIKRIDHRAITRHLSCQSCTCHARIVDFCLVNDGILVKLVLRHIVKPHVIVAGSIVKPLQKVDTAAIGIHRVEIKVTVQTYCLDQLSSLCVNECDGRLVAGPAQLAQCQPFSIERKNRIGKALSSGRIVSLNDQRANR